MDDRVMAFMQELNNTDIDDCQADRFSTWKTENPELRDFSGVVFVLVNFDKTIFHGFDLSNAEFHDCRLRSANFQRVTLHEATFRGGKTTDAHFDGARAEGAVFQSDMRRAKFPKAKLAGAVFDGSDLRDATFGEASLSGASFLNVNVNARTSFETVSSIKDCKIDRFVLACLGDNCGGLTVGNRMEMKTIDDVERLRMEFGGFRGFVVLISMVVFVFPYISFVAGQWLRASFAPEQDQTITMFEALFRYIFNGGQRWRDGWFLHWSVFTFLFVLIYNGVRLALFRKTKQLEMKERISGLPVRFSFEANRGWRAMLKFVSFWGVLIAGLSIAWNTIHFLSMRVPV